MSIKQKTIFITSDDWQWDNLTAAEGHENSLQLRAAFSKLSLTPEQADDVIAWIYNNLNWSWKED